MDLSIKADLDAAVKEAIIADEIKGYQRKLDAAIRDVLSEAEQRGIQINIVGGRPIVVRKKPAEYYDALRRGLAFVPSPSLDGLSAAEFKAAVSKHAGFAKAGMKPKAWSSTKFPPKIIQYAEARLIEAGLMSEAERWDGRGKPRLDTFSKVAKYRLTAKRKPTAETGRDFATGRFEFLGSNQVNWFGKATPIRRKGNGRTPMVRINRKEYGIAAELRKLDPSLTKDTIFGWEKNAEEMVQAARARSEEHSVGEAAQEAAESALDEALNDITQPRRRATPVRNVNEEE